MNYPHDPNQPGQPYGYTPPPAGLDYGPPVQPYQQQPLPPVPPRQSHRGLQIAGAVVALVVVFGTGIAVGSAGGSGDGTPRAAATVTVTAKPGEKPESKEADAGEEKAAGDESLSLTETASYEDGITVALSGFQRRVSSDYASPENTPYARFTVKVTNGSEKNLDLNELIISCQYGDEGKSGEQIFDEGLDSPSTHLRPGRSINVPVGCELPKSERYLQIEVTPRMIADAAIFAGKVQ
ncbi:hypothetical protein G5C51_27055 [Streptomyces sp. A7024]|uniref:DUF4352 domain-containing protein n=1 Tax=Streptomyces coryli TaxID=1128680 RepID=A0A6G4U6D2_9ACTN|nr:hypothetical protein [Streptomyces coryli]NGN67552.1 hypothetical protein [Streptomyces coryli]